MKKIVIKQAELKHKKDLILLLETLFSIEADFDFNPLKHEAALDKIIQTPESICLIAEYNDQAIAMCTAQWVYSTATGKKSAWIEDVVVAPDFQRQGIGKLLLQELLKQCLSLGCNRVQLAYDTTNDGAIEFYEKQGFHKTQLGVFSLGI